MNHFQRIRALHERLQTTEICNRQWVEQVIVVTQPDLKQADHGIVGIKPRKFRVEGDYGRRCTGL